MSIDTRPRRGGGRRLARTLAIVTAATVGLITLVAAPAFADQRCTGQPASNVCLSIDRIDTDHYRVHLGIDFHISRDRAQAIIDAPGDPFNARIFGHAREPIGNQAMFNVGETDIGASAESGLSADFDTTVSRSDLNNDPYPWPFGFDRVFGRIILTQPNGGPTLTFDSPSFPQNF
jgi:hypothetical protein